MNVTNKRDFEQEIFSNTAVDADKVLNSVKDIINESNTYGDILLKVYMTGYAHGVEDTKD